MATSDQLTITVKHNKGFHFTGSDDLGNQIEIDGKREFGNNPTSLLLFGAAACSGIDVVSILEKMRQEITHFEVECQGIKEKVEDHKEWRNIHLIFKLEGEIDPEKAQKAADMSLDKYCSVTKSLRPQSNISFEVWVNGIKA